jgi:hypothetical protein
VEGNKENSNGGGNGTKATVQVHSAEIEQLMKNDESIIKLLNDWIGPNGACERRHAELQKGIIEREKKIILNASQTRWQWGAIVGLAGGLSAWVGYVTRLIVDHFQMGGK